MRAIRLAGATATSMRGLHAGIRASHGSFAPRRAVQPAMLAIATPDCLCSAEDTLIHGRPAMKL